MSVSKLPSFYSIDCILENYHTKQFFSTEAALPLREHLTMSGDNFGYHSWEWGWVGGAAGVEWIETKDITEHHTLLRIALYLRKLF